MSFSDLQVKLMDSFLCDEAIASSNISLDDDNKAKLLQKFHFILNDHPLMITSCLEMLDDSTVSIRKLISSSSSRVFWKVPSFSKTSRFKSGTKHDYLCTTRFCECKNFLEQSKLCYNNVLCKHLVTIRIATALKLVQQEIVTDTKFIELMCE